MMMINILCPENNNMDDVEEVDANFLPLIYDILKRFYCCYIIAL